LKERYENKKLELFAFFLQFKNNSIDIEIVKMEIDSEVSAKVLSCTFSPAEYNQNSKDVLKKIGKDSKNYIQHFLGTLQEIFSNEEFIQNRFFALLLLAKASETKNANLMKQLSNSRDLLNRIFKDAQIDLSKPLKEKGKTFFSKKPTKDESTVGNNYLILLLEAICFWNKEYGSPNPKDSNSCYYTMFTLLSERTQLPGSNYYIGQKLQINDKFYVQPANITAIVEPLKKESATKPQPAAQKATPGEEEITSSEAFMQLITCISSEEDYQTQSQTIFDAVAKNDKTYDKSLLQALSEVLNKPIYTNVYKFYALLLLVQLTETGNKTFLTQLVREMTFLNNLYKQAKEAGDLNGPKIDSLIDADDQEIPYRNQSNILVLEAVKYWHVKYGDKDPEHPYANFTKLYEGLVSKVLFPEEFMYIQAKGVPQRTPKPSSQNQLPSPAEVIDPIMKLVNACIVSASSFQMMYYEVIEQLQNDTQKTPIFLEGILNILKSPTAAPSSKFYALYLLIKVSELIDDPNDLFITALAKNNPLVSKLFEDGQYDKQKPSEQKGTNFFTKQADPQLSILGTNYIQMVSEILHFWGQVFETIERPDPKAVFKLVSNQLKKITMVESEVYYIGRDLESLENETLVNFEFIPYKALPPFNNYMLGSANQLEEQKEPEPVVVVAEPRKQEVVPPIAKQLSNIEEEKDRGGSAPIDNEELEIRLANLQKAKEKLKELYRSSENEKPETKGLLQGLYFQMNSEYMDEILPNIDHIINRQDKDTEKYATIISKEGEAIDNLELDYADYIKGDMSYKDLRRKALVILQGGVEQSNTSRNALNTIQSETSEAQRKRIKEQKFYSSGLEDDKDSQHPSAGLAQKSPLVAAAAGIVNQSARRESERIENPKKAAEVLSSSRPQHYTNQAGQLLSDEESIPSHPSLAKVSERGQPLSSSKINNKPAGVLTGRLAVESLHAGQLLTDEASMMSHVSERRGKKDFNIHLDKHADTSLRHSQHSMVMTPSRNYDQDLSRLEHSIRASKAKIKTLTGIEDNIKKSYMNSGREPPGFKPVADMGVITALEEEVFKLKEEKKQNLPEKTLL